MKVIAKILLSILILNFTFTPTAVFSRTHPTTEKSEETEVASEINSFELFWPIAAGKVMGEPLYFLKSFKERIRELLIFSDFKKADYNITLSEKRTVEAEKLFLEKEDYVNGRKALDAAQTRRERAVALIKKTTEDGKNTADLRNRLVNSLEKQQLLLDYVADRMPEEVGSVIVQNINSLKDLISELQ